MSTSETIKAWHWLRNDRRLGYGDGREVIDGETLSISPEIPPVCCEYGMHGSVKIVDALKYAPGSILCRVEISGDINGQPDKIVGRSRKVLWSITAKQGLELLVAFANECAKRAKEHAKSDTYADLAAASASAASYYAERAAAAPSAASYYAYYASAAYASSAASASAASTYAEEREIQEQWWQTELAKLKPNDIDD